MGNNFSKTIDGSGLPGLVNSPPTPESLKKLQQLLRALVQYKPTDIAPCLISLYYLGGTTSQLTLQFDAFEPKLLQWPEENAIADSIGDESLRDFFGETEYQKRYFEFFRDQLTEFTNWRDIVLKYAPILGERLLYAEAAPLCQLSAAVELDDPVLGMHALAHAAALPESVAPQPGASSSDLETLWETHANSAQIVVVHALWELHKALDGLSPTISKLVGIVASSPKTDFKGIDTWDNCLTQLQAHPEIAHILRAKFVYFELHSNVHT